MHSKVGLFFSIFLCLLGCGKQVAEELAYYPMSADSVLYKTKAKLRMKFHAPPIDEGDVWYYFDGSAPGGIVMTLKFNAFSEVSFYSEQPYDEGDYIYFLPKLINSLRSSDASVRERGMARLGYLVGETVYMSATPQPDLWDPIPFGNPSAAAWQSWWDAEGFAYFHHYASDGEDR